MFKCPIAKKNTRPGDKMVQVITETRDKVYTRRVRDDETGKLNTIVIGRGWEIVKQLGLSEEGAKIYLATHPQARIV